MAYLPIGVALVVYVAFVSTEPIPVHGRGLLNPRCSNHSDPPYPFSSSFALDATSSGSLGFLGTATSPGPIGTGTGLSPLDPTGTGHFPTGTASGPVGSGTLLPTTPTSAVNTTTSFIPPYYSYSLFYPTGISSSTVLDPIGTGDSASGTGFPSSSSSGTAGAPYANSTLPIGTGSSFDPLGTGTAPLDPTAASSLPSGIISFPSGVTAVPSGFTTFLPLPTGTTVPPLPSGVSTSDGGVSLPTGYYYHHGGKGHHKHYNWWDIFHWFVTEIEGEADDGSGDDVEEESYGYSKF